MTGMGVMVRFQLGDRLMHQVKSDPVARLYLTFFNPKKASVNAPLRLLSENVGNTLLCLGVVVILVSDLGLAGALFGRPLLVLFMLMMTMVIMAEIISATFILQSSSYLSLQGREAAAKTLEDQALLTEKMRLQEPWMNGLHVLMIALDCCGVEGPHDFAALYSSKFVPETCCRRDVMRAAKRLRVVQCQNGTRETTETTADRASVKESSVSDHSFRKCEDPTLTESDLKACTWTKPHTKGFRKVQKTKGCYDAIFDSFQSAYPWLMPSVLFFLITQMAMVVSAMHVFNKRISWSSSTKPPTTQPA